MPGLAGDVNEGDGCGVGVGELWGAGDVELVPGLGSWDSCETVCFVIGVDESCCSFGVAARSSPGMASITQQQTPRATPPSPVILSGTERRRRKVKSKDPEVVSFATQLQGILTKIPLRSPALRSLKYCLRISTMIVRYAHIPNPTTLPATTISTQRSQANQ